MKSFKEYIQEGRIKDFAKTAALTAAVGGAGGVLGLGALQKHQNMGNLGARMGLRQPPAPPSNTKKAIMAGAGGLLALGATGLIRKNKKQPLHGIFEI